MRLRLLFVLSAAFIAAPGSGEPRPSVDELVAKNVQAKGGAEALDALKSLRLTGKLLVQQGQIELSYAETRERPDKVRTEASLQGMAAVQAYDGSEGWKISPFQGRKDPEKMSADEVKPILENSEIDGPLVNWQAKGSTLEYLGTEDVEGTAAHKIKVVRKNGDISFVYLDPDHFLEIRIVTERMQYGAQVEDEVDLGDYEKINNVFVPFSIESGTKGDTDKQKTIIEKAEGNVPVDEAIFRFPTTK